MHIYVRIWKTFLHIAASNCHTCHIHKDSHSLTHLLVRGSVGCNTMCDTNAGRRRREIKWVVATVNAAAAAAVAAAEKCAEHKNKIWLNQFAYDIQLTNVENFICVKAAGAVQLSSAQHPYASGRDRNQSGARKSGSERERRWNHCLK